MNYQKVYNQLIERAKSENRVYHKSNSKNRIIYYERHHILPLCMGGEGRVSQWKSHSNIALLTGREHFLAHWLLFRINPNNKKIRYAFWIMCNIKRYDKNNKKYTVSSRAYEEAKKMFSDLKVGVKRDKKTIEKILEYNKNLDPKIKAEQSSRGWETRKKSGWQPKPIEERKKKYYTKKDLGIEHIPYNKGKKRSYPIKDSTKEKLKLKAPLKTKGNIEVYKIDTNEYVGTYYNSVDVGKALNIFKQNVIKVLKGHRRQTGGYYFVRVDEKNIVSKLNYKYANTSTSK